MRSAVGLTASTRCQNDGKEQRRAAALCAAPLILLRQHRAVPHNYCAETRCNNCAPRHRGGRRSFTTRWRRIHLAWLSASVRRQRPYRGRLSGLERASERENASGNGLGGVSPYAGCRQPKNHHRAPTNGATKPPPLRHHRRLPRSRVRGRRMKGKPAAPDA